MDEKIAKGPSFQMSASVIRSEIDSKLHCLARLTHSGVSALAERLRDAKAEARSQRLVNAEVGDLRSGDLRLKDQKD